MKSLAASVLAAFTLTACAVGPDYHRPDLQLPTVFHAAGATSAQAASGANLIQWWNTFNDPELTRLVLLSEQGNLTLRQARARVDASRAMLGAATAELLPSASIEASAARAKQSEETPLGRVLASHPGYDRFGNSYEGNLVAGWELDLFGGLRRGREAAVDEFEASQAGLVAATLEVQAQTADAYLSVRGLQQRLDVARSQVATQQQLADMIRLQFEAGWASALQLHQAEGALSQVQATVPSLEAALEDAMNGLDVIVGRQPGTSQRELARSAPVPIAPSIVSAGGPAGLLRRRPDLIAAERRLAASNAQIGVAISEYYPKLSLSALVGTATTVAGDQFSSPANQASGLLGLHWRLFDFGRVNAEIRGAKARDAEALAAYRLAVLRASEDTENALTALAKRRRQAAILVRGETDLGDAAHEAQLAYKSGSVSLIEVLDANRRLLETRDATIQAQTEASRAAVATFLALGGGWNPASSFADAKALH